MVLELEIWLCEKQDDQVRCNSLHTVDIYSWTLIKVLSVHMLEISLSKSSWWNHLHYEDNVMHSWCIEGLSFKSQLDLMHALHSAEIAIFSHYYVCCSLHLCLHLYLIHSNSTVGVYTCIYMCVCMCVCVGPTKLVVIHLCGKKIPHYNFTVVMITINLNTKVKYRNGWSYYHQWSGTLWSVAYLIFPSPSDYNTKRREYIHQRVSYHTMEGISPWRRLSKADWRNHFMTIYFYGWTGLMKFKSQVPHNHA